MSSTGCSSARFSARRNRANPLVSKHRPRNGDVLSGARFFVAGPARGTAAGAIAQELGDGVNEALASGQPLANFQDSLSWNTFLHHTVDNRIASQSRSVRFKIRMLEKIAKEPTPSRISAYSGGGSPAGVAAQTNKLFCTIMQADPHTVPIITTYFLHAELGADSSTAQIEANAPRFEAQVNAMASAIGRHPAALFIELDAVGSSRQMTRSGSIRAWESMVRYEALKLESLPHTAVYIEGGYSDSNNAGYAARLLNRMGVRQVQGFFTNDTHLQWTSHELAYAKKVSARTGGAHFVINTSANGRGPLLNPHPSTEGVENNCNAPGRGLGIPDNTSEQALNPHLDGLLWLVPPGNSGGSCHGGPPSGTFWTGRAIGLASRASTQLGPDQSSPSH